MKLILSIILIQFFYSNGYSMTSQDLENREEVNNTLRNKISRDIIPSRAYKQSIKNMDTKRSQLNEDKLKSIVTDIRSYPYGPKLTDGHLSQIQDCFYSEGCFLSVYYAGYAATPYGHGRRFYNYYVFYFLNSSGEIQNVQGLLGIEDSFSFDFGSFSIGSKVPIN